VKVITEMRKYITIASMLAVSCLVAVYYAQTRATAQRAEYRSDLRVAEFASIAIANYAAHHKGRLPSSHNWEDSIVPYWSEQPFSVLIQEHPGNRLAMNSKLSGVKLDTIALPDRTILLYETRSDVKDASGSPPWKQYHQCNASAKGWRMLVFASGWASSYAEGPEITFLPKK